MKNIFFTRIFLTLAIAIFGSATASAQSITLSAKAREVLAGKQILYVERHQYAGDHHNTATLFQYGEINEHKFSQGAAIKIFDIDSGTTRTLIKIDTGIVRDPEISFDGKKVVFSMRKNKEEGRYYICRIKKWQ